MNIYVGNLSYNAQDQDLQALFEQFGAVDSARVIIDRESGRSRGFGFVEMSNDGEAQSAIDGTNEAEFMGRKLRVNESKPKPQGNGGGRGSNRY